MIRAGWDLFGGLRGRDGGAFQGGWAELDDFVLERDDLGFQPLLLEGHFGDLCSEVGFFGFERCCFFAHEDGGFPGFNAGEDEGREGAGDEEKEGPKFFGDTHGEVRCGVVKCHGGCGPLRGRGGFNAGRAVNGLVVVQAMNWSEWNKKTGEGERRVPFFAEWG